MAAGVRGVVYPQRSGQPFGGGAAEFFRNAHFHMGGTPHGYGAHRHHQIEHAAEFGAERGAKVRPLAEAVTALLAGVDEHHFVHVVGVHLKRLATGDPVGHRGEERQVGGFGADPRVITLDERHGHEFRRPVKIGKAFGVAA
ncbi:hypothetical protein SDC9_190118 [bioreactor metagenome]|uniref:Uncharacterized protein n=1 Tax=bioreactor metagenome TaxID=1076179 RepID=A0A645HU38_9ZZZZ